MEVIEDIIKLKDLKKPLRTFYEIEEKLTVLNL